MMILVIEIRLLRSWLVCVVPNDSSHAGFHMVKIVAVKHPLSEFQQRDLLGFLPWASNGSSAYCGQHVDLERVARDSFDYGPSWRVQHDPYDSSAQTNLVFLYQLRELLDPFQSK